jgi:predicted lipid-binding transport protein (Tim44 family)
MPIYREPRPMDVGGGQATELSGKSEVMVMSAKVTRTGALSLALAVIVALATIDAADARVGSGGSFGSRGSRTYSPPPTTRTAPAQAKPMDQTMTQPSAAAARQAGTPAGSRFGSGFGGLLLGGLLGAGLFGLLSGAGLFGGITGFASLLGLLLQAALIAGVAYLVVGYFRSRQQPALARPRTGAGGTTLRDGLGGGLGASTTQAAPGRPLAIGSADYNAFERLLGEIQTAYSREDVEALGDMTTPEMLSHFSRDLADNRRQGVRNEVADVKLLQGDLAEAWREAGSDYATVAMRFALRDRMVDRASGRVVAGDGDEEVTEVWTFRRDPGQSPQAWQLSAIQQAAA